MAMKDEHKPVFETNTKKSGRPDKNIEQFKQAAKIMGIAQMSSILQASDHIVANEDEFNPKNDESDCNEYACGENNAREKLTGLMMDINVYGFFAKMFSEMAGG